MNIGDVPLEEKHDGKYYDPSKKEEYIKRAHKISENKKLSKECIACGKVKPLTNEFFNKANHSKDGFMKKCKECRRSKPPKPSNSTKSNESTYEWVRNLPSDKRELLDTDKVAEIIKKELFCTREED